MRTIDYEPTQQSAAPGTVMEIGTYATYFGNNTSGLLSISSARFLSIILLLLRIIYRPISVLSADYFQCRYVF